jgi:hypothetical protein
MEMAIPAGSPNPQEINELDGSETNGFLNEIQYRSNGSVSASRSQYPPDAENRTAVPAGPRNGGYGFEKHGSAFEENSYHDQATAATLAVRWYAENRDACARPIIPALRRMFGLSALEAIQAIRVANGVQR